MFRQRIDFSEYLADFVPRGVNVATEVLDLGENATLTPAKAAKHNSLLFEFKILLIAIGVMNLVTSHDKYSAEFLNAAVASVEESYIVKGNEGIFFFEFDDISDLEQRLNYYCKLYEEEAITPEYVVLESQGREHEYRESVFSKVDRLLEVMFIKMYGKPAVIKAKAQAINTKGDDYRIHLNRGKDITFATWSYCKYLVEFNKQYKVIV